MSKKSCEKAHRKKLFSFRKGLLAVLCAAFFFGAEVLLCRFGGVLACVLFPLIILVFSVFPLNAKNALNALSEASAEVRGALENGLELSLPKGFLTRHFIMAFLPFWCIVPAFLLLPGAVGLIPVIPGLAIACLRTEKTYPLFEDLGVRKKTYVLSQTLAYLVTFSAFFALKMILKL